MRLRPLLLIIFGTAALCALGGALLALVIDRLAPGFYRQPRHGVGIGLGQGAVLGVLAGVALVGLLLWHRRRLDHPQSRATPFGWAVAYLIAATFTLFGIATVGVIWLVTHHHRGQMQQAKLHMDVVFEIVEGDDRFRGVSSYASNRGVILEGELATYRDFHDLVRAIDQTLPPVSCRYDVEVVGGQPAIPEAVPAAAEAPR